MDSTVGDSIKKRLRWMSLGQNTCPADNYSDGKYCKGDWPCAHHSVNCLAGTGDFRIGLFDSLTEEAGYITDDGFADANQFAELNRQLSAPPFDKFRGYHFRISPHVSVNAREYTDPDTGAHTPGGFYVKRDPRSTLFSDTHVGGGVGKGDHQMGGFALQQGGLRRGAQLSKSPQLLSESGVQLGESTQLLSESSTTIHSNFE
jgi:hypothetical protein